MKNLLFIGDVVGKNGCEFLASRIYELKKKYSIDITVINGENSAQGNGITKFSANFIRNSCGADVITTGNHCYKRRESLAIYKEDNILRPANYPVGCFGKGVCVLDMGAFRVAVVNLMGTSFMEPLDNPFTVIENILEEIDTPNIFVDFHAEATAEKKAMGYFLAGKATAVMGTHTHVQTSDETVIDGHTGYITDAGMTGPEYSILGVDVKLALDKMRFKYPVKFREAETPCFINGVVITFDEKIGKCTKITRVIER
ncbi:MAG: YmdB family metallophosphoesterase [Clostridium sp.]|nr:YmdB family metallophosphoesterase [Clostridium sp.]MCM1548323.1 YmdB family metallophosphoesterase [Ruminococcus sp.]